MIVLHTNAGDIELELDFINAPVSASNFQQYAESGFYDGTLFHRVIDGFIIQGGGFEPGMKQKQPGQPIENEAEKTRPNRHGTVAMARTSDPHSATSQFFINVNDNHFLDHTARTPQGWGYAVFGRVTGGMDVVDRIRCCETGTVAMHQDVPEEDIVIESVTVRKDDSSDEETG